MNEMNGRRCVVAGGGIAGMAAATVLAERGVAVTLVERESFLGGRAGAWTDRLESGETFQMERGFHAFFRQYYNLRSWLCRIDSELSFLEPLDDYPILAPEGRRLSFSRLPRRAPWNVAALALRSPLLGWRELRDVDVGRAMQMLTYDPERTYARFDHLPAGQYLDSLGFPAKARQLFFDVFAHSFFNPEEEMSAAELLMMFHFYFLRNREGLIFDVVRSPFSTALWEPMERYLRDHGVEIAKGESVLGIDRAGSRWSVQTDGRSLEADGVVLALDVGALRRVVRRSPRLDEPVWRRYVDSLDQTLPFAVWRLWLDRPTDADRPPFAGTTGFGCLDNISLYHLFEDESREWAERRGGSVVELHAYAVREEVDESTARQQMLEGLHELYPETRSATVLEERWLWRQDCPAFGRGSDARRPGVETPFEGLTLAGDFVKLSIPSALMERAAASGLQAANRLLEPWGLPTEPIRSVPERGLFAGVARGGAGGRT